VTKLSRVLIAVVVLFIHPQHIKVLKHFIYIQYECGMQSTGAFSLNHHIKTSLQLSPTPIFLHSTHHLHRHSSIRVDKYAHPLHVKVLKHFTYIQYGCGMQSTGAWSPNHHITTSLRLSPIPIFLNSTPDLHRRYGIRVDPYAHVRGRAICPPTANQGAKTLYIYPIWMWDAVHRGLEPQSSHNNIIQAQSYPNFPKFHP
jgi:hypothetical protein